MIRKPVIVFVLGPPASGKGTLSRRLSEEHGLCHISVGDYLRSLTAVGGSLAGDNTTVDSVKSGGTKGLVRTETLIPLLVEKVEEQMKAGKEVFLLDGFPRSIEQDTAFKKIVKEKWNMDTPDFTVFIHCEKAVARARYLGRNDARDDAALFEGRYGDFLDRDMKVVNLYEGSLIEVNGDMTGDECYHELTNGLKSRDVKFLKPSRE